MSEQYSNRERSGRALRQLGRVGLTTLTFFVITGPLANYELLPPPLPILVGTAAAIGAYAISARLIR